MVGFSHGADSTALLAMLQELRGPLRLPELLAVTIDHGLREASAAECKAAVKLAEDLGVAHVVERVRCRRPSETAAREARYEAFARLASAHGAAGVFLAHHARDQRETLLLRMLRGTGPLGLCGIPERRRLHRASCEIVRPLLGEEPEALRSYLVSRQISWVEDASNADAQWTMRNRIRHEILPALEARRPGCLEALRAEACALRRAVEDEAPVCSEAQDAAQTRVALRTTASPWARERIALACLDARGQRRPTRALAQRLATLFGNARIGSIVESRGHWRATRRRDHVEFAWRSAGNTWTT